MDALRCYCYGCVTVLLLWTCYGVTAMDTLRCYRYGHVKVLLHVVEGIIRESSAHRCGILLKQNLKVTG